MTKDEALKPNGETELYTSPPKRQPLTDEQIDNLGRKEKDALLDFIYENGTASDCNYFFKKYARVILAAAIERAYLLGRNNAVEKIKANLDTTTTRPTSNWGDVEDET